MSVRNWPHWIGWNTSTSSTGTPTLTQKNARGRSTTASMSVNQNENDEITNSFFLKNLNPGNTLEGNIVFDVNESFVNNSEKVIQAQEDMFGTNTGHNQAPVDKNCSKK